MTQPSLFEDEPFPWPQPNPDAPAASSMHGLVDAMTWPGLTLEERCVAMFVGDGAGGPGSETSLCQHLGISRTELDATLLALLRKGFLAHVARWWAE